MTITLPFTAPKTKTIFRNPLLTASSHVTNQAAGVALRSWWRRSYPKERIERGLVIRRSDIAARNNESSERSIPTLQLSFRDADDHEVILAAFADQSVLVLRAVAPNTQAARQYPGAHEHEFRVLPIVLRLASVANQQGAGVERDGLGCLTLRVRGNKSPVLAVGRASDKDSWVNIEAGWTMDIGGVTEDVRSELLHWLSEEAQAWACLLDEMPALANPIDGQPVPGPAGSELARDTGCSDDLLVAAPAALPWRAYTEEDAKSMQAFCIEICAWLSQRLGADWGQVELDLYAAQPGQKARKAEPEIKLSFHRAGGHVPEQASRQLSDVVRSILRSPHAPVPYTRLVGQVERDWLRRRTWLERADIARVFATTHQPLMSNHELIELHARFDPFWQGDPS